MKYRFFVIIFLSLSAFVARGQGGPGNLPADISSASQTVSPTSTKNYIITYTFRKSDDTIYTGGVSPVIQYFDGLGRVEETVSVKATQSGSDLVSYQTYDVYGRSDTTFLPCAISSNAGAYIGESSFKTQQNTFLTSFYGFIDGSKGYAVTGYEASPLNRVLKQGAPGASWQLNAHPVQFDYKTNTSAITSWKYSGDTYTSFSYAAGKLFLNQTTDEDENVVKEYTDFEGKMVRKEVSDGACLLVTHYCYDDFGLLRCVVQPMGNSPADTNYCFYYKYDSRRRLTDKYTPGGCWIYYIYDARDRVVLTQDAKQRAYTTGQWTYSVYDELNRLSETGIWADTIPRDTLVSRMSSSSNLTAKHTPK